MEKFAIRLQAEVAEFWVNNQEFREAVNSADGTDVRLQLLAAINESGMVKDSNPLAFLRGRVISAVKSDMRKHLLAFLESLAQSGHYNYETGAQQALKPDSYLTEGQREAKRRVNTLYGEGKYTEALAINLGLLANRRVHRNPGVLGAIANCYWKMKDAEHALEYAERVVRLVPDDLCCLGMAACAAQQLQKYDKALEYARRYLEQKVDVTALGIAAVCCEGLGYFDERDRYAQARQELGQASS